MNSNSYADMGGFNVNRQLGTQKGAREALDDLRRRVGQNLDEWVIDPAEPAEGNTEDEGEEYDKYTHGDTYPG